MFCQVITWLSTVISTVLLLPACCCCRRIGQANLDEFSSNQLLSSIHHWKTSPLLLPPCFCICHCIGVVAAGSFPAGHCTSGVVLVGTPWSSTTQTSTSLQAASTYPTSSSIFISTLTATPTSTRTTTFGVKETLRANSRSCMVAE